MQLVVADISPVVVGEVNAFQNARFPIPERDAIFGYN